MKRSIDKGFLQMFLDGPYAPLLKAVHRDNTLNMELRGKEVKIYYRGRLICTIEGDTCSIKCNETHWDECKDFVQAEYYNRLKISPAIQEFAQDIFLYKIPIDYLLASKSGDLEEQAKQQLVLENNVLFKNSSKSGDYFILDTEYAINTTKLNARFDAIALRWPSVGHIRKNRSTLGLSIVEMKYGDEAKNGTAGIAEHIRDYREFITMPEYHEMCKDMEAVFRQKCKLGLIPAYNNSDDEAEISIEPTNVDLVFMFANSDPDSKILVNELRSVIENTKAEEISDIYIAKSSEIGYTLFRYEKNGDDRYIRIKDYYESIK